MTKKGLFFPLLSVCVCCARARSHTCVRVSHMCSVSLISICFIAVCACVADIQSVWQTVVWAVKRNDRNHVFWRSCVSCATTSLLAIFAHRISLIIFDFIQIRRVKKEKAQLLGTYDFGTLDVLLCCCLNQYEQQWKNISNNRITEIAFGSVAIVWNGHMTKTVLFYATKAAAATIFYVKRKTRWIFFHSRKERERSERKQLLASFILIYSCFQWLCIEIRNWFRHPSNKHSFVIICCMIANES